MRSSKLVIACIIFTAIVTSAEDIDNRNLQCLVCRSTIKEVKEELSKVDPKRNIEIGNYRLDAEGNEIRKKIPMARSEVHISDVLDGICEKLSDYVRATYKSNGELMIMNLVSPSGGMNPEMSKVDIIQDGDLNKSLKFLCEEIIEEHEEPILKVFQKGESDVSDVIDVICTEKTSICDDVGTIDKAREMDDEDEDERTEL